jgi:hypothetical protein
VRLSETPTHASGPLPSYDDWRAAFDLKLDQTERRRSADRAIDDLRMLLLGTEQGPYPAAGLPWFSNIFGRDALLTAQMLLPWRPEIAVTVLRRLALEQGRVTDPFREEEPGKIAHEIRRGELSRTGKIPFGRYYGSVDATALYVTLVEALVQQTGEAAPVAELRSAWEPAVRWLAGKQQDEGGLIAFSPSGSGLAVQSWKDSSDSMNHADGSPAEAPLAVAECRATPSPPSGPRRASSTGLGERDRAQEFAERATVWRTTSIASSGWRISGPTPWPWTAAARLSRCCPRIRGTCSGRGSCRRRSPRAWSRP